MRDMARGMKAAVLICRVKALMWKFKVRLRIQQSDHRTHALTETVIVPEVTFSNK
jgi:hypothetical protein